MILVRGSSTGVQDNNLRCVNVNVNGKKKKRVKPLLKSCLSTLIDKTILFFFYWSVYLFISIPVFSLICYLVSDKITLNKEKTS